MIRGLGAETTSTYSHTFNGRRVLDRREPSRRVAAVAWKGVARACLEPPPVQILVVVANTQVRTLRTEVGEGFHVNSVCTWVSRSLANGEIRARRDFRESRYGRKVIGLRYPDKK
ncbi:hypothetical protein NPIL_163591 [Nephila pilipes]|uniref:Uncharacterized protein n=1 Tax=Nephila pilipes TaxID=299642 RepID=A0A8X6T5M9_NEPPI|nr:hypothetical protein NPIL_163591 [Nephila pilipes]